MLTANEQVLHGIVERQIKYLQYSNGVSYKNYKKLQETEDTLRDLIFSYYSRLSGELYTKENQKLLKELDEKLILLRGAVWNDIYKDLKDEFTTLAKDEVVKTGALIESAVPVSLGLTTPSTQVLAAIVVSQPFEGAVLKTWINRTANADINTITTAVKNGITDGLTAKQVVHNLIGTKSGTYPKSAAIRKAQRNMLSTVLTATSSISNHARSEFYKSNSDVIKEEIFVSVLDIRTTFECADNNAKIFPLGEGPKPPLHFRCRSVRVVYLNPENLSNRPLNPANERELLEEYSKENGLKPVKNRASLPRGHKGKFDIFSRERTREMIGSAPLETTFDDFLRSRSKAFQDDYLGPARADLYRKNPNMKIGNFVNNEGKRLTLEQLTS